MFVNNLLNCLITIFVYSRVYSGEVHMITIEFTKTGFKLVGVTKEDKEKLSKAFSLRLMARTQYELAHCEGDMLSLSEVSFKQINKSRTAK